MQLRTYLADAKITYGDFARLIGAANASVVAKYARGKRVPRPRFMAAIERATEGKVGPLDFYDTTSLPDQPAHQGA